MPNAPDLTTVDVVKGWLAIPAPQTGSDAMLGELVTATSMDFLRAIDRTDLLAADYTEVRDGDGNNRLMLRHWPVNAVTSLVVAGTAVAPSADKVAAGYYVDGDLDLERRSQLYLVGSVFKDGGVVQVVYNAGYVAVPDDVAQAVVDWVAARYKGRPGVGLTSQRDATGEHASYDRESAMPATTAATVERYKRCWPSLDKRNDDRDYKITRINRTVTMVEKAT